MAKECQHKLKIKATCKALYSKNQQNYSDRRVKSSQRFTKPMALWTLQLAGDCAHDDGTASKHLMRVMLVPNADVKARFAN